MRWEQVCMPKNEGGLGLHRVKEFNDASLLKLGWSVATSDSLWASWFRGNTSCILPSGFQETPRQDPVYGKGLEPWLTSFSKAAIGL